MQLLVGTDEGLYELTDGTPRRLRDGRISHLAADPTSAWVIANDKIERLTEPSRENLALPDGLKPRCLLATEETAQWIRDTGPPLQDSDADIRQIALRDLQPVLWRWSYFLRFVSR